MAILTYHQVKILVSEIAGVILPATKQFLDLF
jgi:hypothetical protein